MKPIFVLNGPNLNMLGLREPQVYGTETLNGVESRCVARGAALGFAIDFRQSNSEGDLVTWIHEARGKSSGIALKAADVPTVELHLSNVHKREAFRHHSMIAAAVNGVICGFGSHGYELAIEAIATLVNANKKG
jgi:3-dehydroquinate dehydratase II